MTSRRRYALGVLIVAVLATASSETVRGFVVFGSKWPNGTITMHLQLAGGSGLSDGSASFNGSMAGAMSTWNQSLGGVQFAAVQPSSVPRVDGDAVNQVFFDSTYYGTSFGTGTLAITTRWEIAGTQRTEADIVFNTAFQWDSYRGNVRTASDLRRVALHELGHALGLNHPDTNGQSVTALMNSTIGNLDELSADDIAGAQSLYGGGGGGGVTSNITFPPRNEPADFYNQLQGVYQNELRAAQASTYVNSEGTVIWLTEYTRQRVGQCTHQTATDNTIAQITSNGGTLVCGTTPAGPIPFPPRNEGVAFMAVLESTYRDTLGAPLGPTFVNSEGAVVWVMEYLRYRLNACNHGDATTKVFQQIRGQGIQPTCTA